MNEKRITFVVVSALFALSAPVAMADPCGAILCLSTNKTAPHECKGHVDEYFNIRVYRTHKKKKIFDPGATAQKRYSESMDKCDGARQQDKDYVNGLYGTLERSPWDYVDVDSSSGESTGYSADSLTQVVETRYLTCAQAATMPAYSGMVGTPSAAARQLPEGAILTDNGGQQVQISGGWANHVIATDNSNGWGGTPVYGFAVETRTLTKTSGQGVLVSETEWTATKTTNCQITDPYSYWQQYNMAYNGGGGG